jgi:hypothetical protein
MCFYCQSKKITFTNLPLKSVKNLKTCDLKSDFVLEKVWMTPVLKMLEILMVLPLRIPGPSVTLWKSCFTRGCAGDGDKDTDEVPGVCHALRSWCPTCAHTPKREKDYETPHSPR